MIQNDKSEKNKFLYIVFFLLGLLMIFIEISIMNFLPIITPNITFIFILLFSIYYDGYFMPLIALLCGFILDSLVGKFIGQYTLLFSVASYIFTELNHDIRKDVVFVPFFLCTISFIVEYIINFLIDTRYYGNFFKQILILLTLTYKELLVNVGFCLFIILIITFFIKKKQVI